MTALSTIRIRLALLGALVAVIGLALLPEAYSQPGRPGFPGRPPTMPAPPAFPNRPNFPPAAPGTAPSVPGTVPSTPGNPGMLPPGGPGTFPGVPHVEIIWKCSGCGAILGRGPVRPSLSQCPNCGARFLNGTPPAGTPATGAKSPSVPDLVSEQVASESSSAPTSSPPAATAAEPAPETSDSPGLSKGGKVLAWVLGGLFVAGLVTFVVALASKPDSPRPRRRRRAMT